MIEFKTDKIRMLFSEKDGSIISIADNENYDYRMSGKIFNIKLVSAGGERIELTNQSFGRFSYRKGKDKSIFFKWKLDDKAIADVVVSGSKTNGGIEFRFSMNCPDKKYFIEEVSFPTIGVNDNDKGLALVFPWQWGYLVNDAVNYVKNDVTEKPFWQNEEPGAHKIEGGYPGMLSMQFMALYNNKNRKGLYFSAYDPDSNYKRMGVYWNAAQKNAELIFKNYPESGKRNYTVDYPVVIDVFNGDWYKAAEMYRAWAARQRWCEKGKLEKRKDIPGWLYKIGLWYWNWQDNTRGTPDDIIPAVKELKKYFKANTALHWYGWHGRGHDTDYPDFFPKKKADAVKLKRAVAELGKNSVKAIPYINGRLCEQNTATWKREHLSEYACRKEDASLYSEGYNNRKFVIMCPSTAYWQNKVKNITKTIIRDYGFNGVYIDQVSSAYPVLCYSGSHGHARGGGNHWAEGYRKMMKLRDEIKRKDPEIIFTSESCLETYIGCFDAFLGYLGSDTAGNFGGGAYTIPLFPAVYHDYIITYGTVNHIKDKIEERFYLGEAISFTSGNQPMVSGFFSEDRNNSECIKRLEYIKKMVEAREKYFKYFTYGQYEPVNMKCDDVNIKVSDEMTKTFPSIIASCFRIRGNSAVTVLVNHTPARKKAVLFLKEGIRESIFINPRDIVVLNRF